MANSLSPDQLQRLLNQGLNMSFSPVIVQLVQTILDPDSDVRQIARILGMDPVLSAAIVRLANTPYFGMTSPVTSLEQATMLLGTKEILKLAFSISIKKGLAQHCALPPDKFYQAWRTIIWGAIVGEKLSAVSKTAPPEMAYLTILLKDIALFLLYDGKEEAFWVCPSECRAKDAAREIKRWGHTHAEIAGQLALNWKLPQNIVQAISAHHTEIADLGPKPDLTLIVAVATRWSELMHSLSPDVENLIQLEILISDLFGLSPAIIQALREESIQDFKSMLQLLEIPESPLDERLYELPMETIKAFYFLSLELANTGHELADIANILGRHLDLYWQANSWHLYLQVPKRDGYMHFSQNPEYNAEICRSGPFPATAPRRHEGQVCFALTSSGTTPGELHLPLAFLQNTNELNFRNYLRMISQGLHDYYQYQADLSSQAAMFKNLPVGVARLDSTGLVLEANNMLRKHLNIAPNQENISLPDVLEAHAGELIRENWQKITAPDGPQHVSSIINFQKNPGKQDTADNSSQAFLALYRWGEFYQDEVLAVLEDITELSELETQTLQQRDFMNNMFRVMQEIVLTINGTGHITWVAPPNQHLRDKNFFELCRPTPTTHLWGPDILTDSQALSQPVEVGIKISEERFGLFEFAFAPLKTENSYLLVGRDLTNLRRLAAQIKRQAFNDGLTGLFNHGHFHTLLAAQVSLQKQKGFPLGLMFMDLDKFKNINDEEGHSAGDAILKAVAQILLSEVRQGNDYACRYGGDEFTVIVPGITPAGLEAMALRIIEQVPNVCDNKVFASIGLALLKEGETAADFLHRAGRAVYSIKRNGGNGFAWG